MSVHEENLIRVLQKINERISVLHENIVQHDQVVVIAVHHEIIQIQHNVDVNRIRNVHIRDKNIIQERILMVYILHRLWNVQEIVIQHLQLVDLIEHGIKKYIQAVLL